jgi:hypothetical protein
MSSSDLIRWSALAALVGGVLVSVLDVAFFVLIGDVPESEGGLMGAWVPLQVVVLIAIVLGFLGLVGMYARQAEKAGALGLVAFLVAFVGTALIFGFTWAGTFIVPTLAEAAPDILDEEPSGVLATGLILTFILFALGWLLFGLATLLTKVLSRGAAVLLMIGAVLSFVLGFLEVPFSEFVFGIALAWMGYELWSEKGEEAIQPESAT